MAGVSYLAGYVSMSHYVIDLLFGFHDQESQESLLTCQVKQNQSQTTMTTESHKILLDQLLTS